MKSFKDIRTKKVEESSAAWAKSLETIAKKKQLDKISDKDKKTLMKIAAMMAKEQVDEALVASNASIVGAIMNKLQDYFTKGLHDDDEKKLAQLNQTGRLVNMGVTRKKQAKGRAFLYKLKK